jgi:hypothetical protein
LWTFCDYDPTEYLLGLSAQQAVYILSLSFDERTEKIQMGDKQYEYRAVQLKALLIYNAAASHLRVLFRLKAQIKSTQTLKDLSL